MLSAESQDLPQAPLVRAGPGVHAGLEPAEPAAGPADALGGVLHPPLVPGGPPRKGLARSLSVLSAQKSALKIA